MFCNRAGRFLNPESLSQLFDRVVQRAGLPRIRFHDLRHTHASLLVAHGVPIKVVTATSTGSRSTVSQVTRRCAQ
jgi:integrase